MTEQQPINQDLEENLPMVNYIMLHRIYDMLTLIANHLDAEKTKGIIEYHTQGYLLGPTPSYVPNEEE